MQPVIYIINGPNLNLLGIREPEIYGKTTLAELKSQCLEIASNHNTEVVFYQSNKEFEIVEIIQQAIFKNVSGIIINPAAFSHYSIAILDALNAYPNHVIELHISNIYKREEFRHFSFVSKRADGIICGLGTEGYVIALNALLNKIKGD